MVTSNGDHMTCELVGATNVSLGGGDVNKV